MWLNERRRGPGWSASSRRQAAPLPPRPPAQTARPRHPRAGPLPAGKTPLLGPPQGPARGLGVSGSPAPGSRLRPAGRASAAAGAAPQEPPPRTVLLARAGGGGGGAGPLKSAARRPDPPPAAPRWSRLDCGQGLPGAALAAGRGPRRPQQLGQQPQQRRPTFWVRVRWTFLLHFLFLFFHPATVT